MICKSWNIAANCLFNVKYRPGYSLFLRKQSTQLFRLPSKFPIKLSHSHWIDADIWTNLPNISTSEHTKSYYKSNITFRIPPWEQKYVGWVVVLDKNRKIKPISINWFLLCHILITLTCLYQYFYSMSWNLRATDFLSTFFIFFIPPPYSNPPFDLIGIWSGKSKDVGLLSLVSPDNSTG